MSQELNTAPGSPPALAGLSGRAREAAAAGMPASTRRAYREDVARFLAWCAAAGFPGLPADSGVLTEYAAHAAYDLGWSPSYIERSRWAILKWHSLAGFPPPAADGLTAVLKGYHAALAMAKDPRAAPRKATPAGKETLRVMLATLDRSSPSGCRDAFILLGGFAIAGRRGEIASLDIPSIEFAARGMQVSVYRQKTRQLDNPVVHYRPDEDLCPVRAAGRWMAMLAAAGRVSGPLCVRIDRHGNLAPSMRRSGAAIGAADGRMSGQAVGQVISRCAGAAGLAGRWTGHSLRRGLATQAHGAGRSRRADRDAGRLDGRLACGHRLHRGRRPLARRRPGRGAVTPGRARRRPAPPSDAILIAELTGAALHHVPRGWRDPASEQTAGAVAELQGITSRPDLLAQAAGVMTGFSRGGPYERRDGIAAGFLVAAGADESLIEQWIEVGRKRAEGAGMPPARHGR